MTMIKIPAASARARSDQRAFLAAEQRPAHGPYSRPDGDVLGLAMVVTVRPAVRKAFRGKGKK